MSINGWLSRWRDRLNSETHNDHDRKIAMLSYNPAYIPRNHRIEEAIQFALKDDYSFFDKLCEILSNPFNDQLSNINYKTPPLPREIVRQTFCGT